MIYTKKLLTSVRLVDVVVGLNLALGIVVNMLRLRRARGRFNYFFPQHSNMGCRFILIISMQYS